MFACHPARVQAAGVTPGSGGAADLLGALGVWGPHDNIGLRQLGMTPEFPAQLQAGPPAFLKQPPLAG